MQNYKNDIFKITDCNFKIKALEAYRYQYEQNKIYRQYSQQLHRNPDNVHHLTDIPFLPIDFFKHSDVYSTCNEPQHYFLSSGTTGRQRSKHLMFDLNFYHHICKYCFEQRFSPLSESIILALLPGYTENPHSSLISMVKYFVESTGSKHSQFISPADNDVEMKIRHASEENKPIYLFSVTHALLSLCKKKIDLNTIHIIETGGMKGMGKEITKEELFEKLQQDLHAYNIHSEYGMTELLSQAYAVRSYWYTPPPWMKVLIRELNDPFHVSTHGKGAFNIIDLANIETCCFIETQDMGMVNPDGLFYVSGRTDHSDVRGCNLLYLT
ncbi:MAG: acyl transferase [Cytophagaceae bacterium]|nr:acyl transferase [Cytophagaceae bacterium]MDW8455194.1 acyl transferase [Cytophagaceae bacterium]